MIGEMEARFSFLGQVTLPEDAFAAFGSPAFPPSYSSGRRKAN